jgi:hypothetical protein
MDQQEILEAWCQAHKGLFIGQHCIPYADLDWTGFYPECDSDMLLTGKIIPADSCCNHVSVAIDADEFVVDEQGEMHHVVAMMRR